MMIEKRGTVASSGRKRSFTTGRSSTPRAPPAAAASASAATSMVRAPPQPRGARLVESGATLSADATGKGNGGTVVVWADEVTAFYGKLTAKGGAAGGNGGTPKSPARMASPSMAPSI